jgi:hypothetical protein
VVVTTTTTLAAAAQTTTLARRGLIWWSVFGGWLLDLWLVAWAVVIAVSGIIWAVRPCGAWRVGRHPEPVEARVRETGG